MSTEKEHEQQKINEILNSKIVMAYVGFVAITSIYDSFFLHGPTLAIEVSKAVAATGFLVFKHYRYAAAWCIIFLLAAAFVARRVS